MGAAAPPFLRRTTPDMKSSQPRGGARDPDLYFGAEVRQLMQNLLQQPIKLRVEASNSAIHTLVSRCTAPEKEWMLPNIASARISTAPVTGPISPVSC